MAKKNSKNAGLLHQSWYNTEYMMIHGLKLPSLAIDAICDLITIGRYENLEQAIQEAVTIVIQENTPSLTRNKPTWYGLKRIRDLSRLAQNAKPDNLGLRNLHYLEQMYAAIRRDSE